MVQPSPESNRSTPPPDITSTTPTKPLSELYLIAPGILNLGGILNRGQNICFHTYKSSPAIFYLSISNSNNFFTLHSGTSSKDPVVADSYPGPGEREFVVVQSSDRFKSKITKDGRDIYSWHVPASQWALKHDVTDKEESGIGKELVFQWRRMNLEEGTKASFLNPNWKLVDKSTEEVHAVFVEKWDGSTERGQLQFRRSFGIEWEMGVLLSVGIVDEGERQRRSKRGNFTKGFFMY